MHENFHLTCSVVHFIDHLLARCIACDLSLSARVVDTTAFQDSGFNTRGCLQTHWRNPDVSIQGVVAVITQAVRRIIQGGSPIRRFSEDSKYAPPSQQRYASAGTEKWAAR